MIRHFEVWKLYRLHLYQIVNIRRIFRYFCSVGIVEKNFCNLGCILIFFYRTVMLMHACAASTHVTTIDDEKEIAFAGRSFAWH